MAIYISGSLAYDRIMRFPGNFADSILPDQLHSISVSFFIDHFEEKFGGIAGNIAYALYLLDEKPTIIASVGKDFGPYQSALLERGLPLEGISIYAEQLTASCYITTDQKYNQITAFHAAAMLAPSNYIFPTLSPDKDLAIICPSNPSDMTVHPLHFRNEGVRYIYDPAQQLPVLQADDIRAVIEGAYLLMGNDYELELIMAKTEYSKMELLAMTTAGIVCTVGEKGSWILHKDGREEHIPAALVPRVADPTGGGDAYRAGFLKGLLEGRELAEAARMGTICAAFCIENYGPQNYTWTRSDFAERYTQNFGPLPAQPA